MYLRDARHLDKFMYALGGDLFYEPFEKHYRNSEEYRDLVSNLLQDCDEEWNLTRDGVWFHAYPPKTNLPNQGWKIHISATLSNSRSILEKVAIVTLSKRVPFKFLLDTNMLSLTTSKKWDRGSSGKFITVYPPDTSAFMELLESLHSELRNEEGPYILSDRRYKECGVLYYRFGGITPNTEIDMRGERIPILVSPKGIVVPDIRTPFFSLPEWVRDPFPNEVADSPDITLKDGRYLVKQALSFSNSGGVYLAEDQSNGQQVVVKEARRHTLQDREGRDAITLLKKEALLLEYLQGTGATPKALDSFYDWEHFFLVQEFIPGVDIRELMLGESPLMRVNPSLPDTSLFYEIFLSTFKSFVRAIAALHEQGVVFGDLSASNIKIDPLTYAVRLIDLEGAYRIGVEEPTYLFTPGFRNPSNLKSAPRIEDDLYALAAIMLYMMFPIPALAALRSDLYSTVLRVILQDIGWAETNIFQVVNGFAEGNLGSAEALELLENPGKVAVPRYVLGPRADTESETGDLCGFILSSIRNDGDNLFPADPFVHRTNSLSLGFGACGVLYALKKCDREIPNNALDWLQKKIEASKHELLPPGLFTGSAGVAWTLYELELKDHAIEFMERANNSSLLKSHHSYFYGMAGIGMANLFFYRRTGRTAYLSAAEHLAEMLLADAREGDEGIFWENERLIHIGLGYGQSGVALFLLRLSQIAGKEKYLSPGQSAIRYDLSSGLEIEAGVLSFPRGTADFTLDPYLEEGSAGVAKVALRFGLWEQMDLILTDVHRKYSSYAGLYYGLSGFVDVLTDAYIHSKDKRFLEMAERPLAGLRQLYFIKHPTGIATPGEGLLRTSCDYATGTAGVMRALHRFTHLGAADFVLDGEE